MPQVSVNINGRKFRVACEEGQENHLTELAADLDGRIEKLRAEHGEIGDARLTIMAALTLEDELAELGGKLRGLEAELAALQDTRVTATDRAKATQAALSAALNSAAERIEGMTKRINQTRGEVGGVAMG